MPTTVVLDYQGGPEAMQRGFRAALAETLEERGEEWHEEVLPEHFTERSARVYKYKARNRGYMRKKGRGYKDQYGRRHAGHLRALYWSGESERMLTAGARIRVTRAGLSVRMLAPKHFYQRRKDLNQPDKAAEATRLTQREIDRQARDVEGGVTRRLNAIRTHSTRVLQ